MISYGHQFVWKINENVLCCEVLFHSAHIDVVAVFIHHPVHLFNVFIIMIARRGDHHHATNHAPIRSSTRDAHSLYYGFNVSLKFIIDIGYRSLHFGNLPQKDTIG